MSSYLIYCGEDGLAGKAIAMKLRKEGHRATLADAGVFSGRADPCDRVVIMPDVPAWKRERIEAVYGLKVMPTNAAPVQSPAIHVLPNEVTVLVGEVPAEFTIQGGPIFDPRLLTAKHRGHGKYYVMNGDEIVSGPHSKDEAQRLAG